MQDKIGKSCLDQYRELCKRLHVLIEQGRDETEEGDTLRDEMDPMWYGMSEEERELIRNESRGDCT